MGPRYGWAFIRKRVHYMLCFATSVWSIQATKWSLSQLQSVELPSLILCICTIHLVYEYMYMQLSIHSCTAVLQNNHFTILCKYFVL